mmetsp:Transcript_3780/g.508  ORF Transcript_3780/g.508 Transcript_3780/m.508 type:complete len:108 (+) Transcript_3780:785-1108(+)
MSKYMTRTMGDDAFFGSIFAVHAISMISAVVISTILASKLASYTSIVIGSMIGIIGTFIMFQDANYTAIVIFVVFVSFGEGILSPRLLDYVVSIAPEGAEGTYLALF